MIGKNNPFNIRSSRKNKWIGQSGSRKGFACFSDQYFGIRAAIKIVMCSYRNFGLRTIQKILGRFAPNTENNTQAYVKYVVSKTKIPPLKVLNSQMDYVLVLKAMSEFEGNPVTLEEILHVMELSNLKMSVFYEEEDSKVD